MNTAVAARAAKGTTPRWPRGDFLLGSLRRVQHEPLELLREGFREYGDVVR